MTNGSTSPRHISEESETEYAVQGVRPRGFVMIYHETSLAMSRANMTSTAYRVYLYLCHLADKFGKSIYPKQETIGAHLGVSQGAVSKAVQELERAGFLEVSHRTRNGKRGINLYQLIDYQPPQNSTELGVLDSHNIPSGNMEIFPQGITNQDVITNTQTSNSARKEKPKDAPKHDDIGNASRMKSNWRPPASEITKMREELNWTPERIEHELLTFIDYWLGRKDGRVNWVATWRSRMREKAGWEQNRTQRTADKIERDDESLAKDGMAAL